LVRSNEDAYFNKLYFLNATLKQIKIKKGKPNKITYTFTQNGVVVVVFILK